MALKGFSSGHRGSKDDTLDGYLLNELKSEERAKDDTPEGLFTSGERTRPSQAHDLDDREMRRARSATTNLDCEQDPLVSHKFEKGLTRALNMAHVSKRILGIKKQLKVKEQAAIRIQKHWRGYLARTQLYQLEQQLEQELLSQQITGNPWTLPGINIKTASSSAVSQPNNVPAYCPP